MNLTLLVRKWNNMILFLFTNGTQYNILFLFCFLMKTNIKIHHDKIITNKEYHTNWMKILLIYAIIFVSLRNLSCTVQLGLHYENS